MRSVEAPDARTPDGVPDFLTPKEAASFLRLSLSWLAKARGREDGPPFMQFGRAVRYSKEALIRWAKLQAR